MIREVRRAAIATAIIVSASLLGLGAAEALTRLLLPAFDPSGRFEFDYQVGSLWLGHPDTRARQTKNTGDFDVTVRINRHGLRDSNDVSRATPADLVVVGDSFAWGWGVEEEQRFSNVIERKTRIRTFNVSTPTDLEGYLKLLEYAHSLGAHVGKVLLAVSMESDLGYYGPQPSTVNSEEQRLDRLKIWLESHSAAYILLTTVVHRTPWMKTMAVQAGLIIPNLEGISGNEDRPDIVKSSAEMIQKISRKQRTLVMVIPSRALWTGSHRAVEDRVHRALVAALAERGVEVLDLRPLFEADGRPLSFHFTSDGHWNSRGHELVAKAIVERLSALGFDAPPRKAGSLATSLKFATYRPLDALPCIGRPIFNRVKDAS